MKLFLAPALRSLALVWVLSLLASSALAAGDWPILLYEDFSKGSDRWQPTDPEAWTIEKDDEAGAVLSLNVKRSDYSPPHRSPHNIALLKDVSVGSFELIARVARAPSWHVQSHSRRCHYAG